MARGNCEIVREAFVPWQAGDWDTFAEFLDPDMTWDLSANPLPDLRNQGRGRDEFIRDMVTYTAGFVNYEALDLDLSEVGDDVVAVTHERATLRGTDDKIDRIVTVVWTVRDGKFTQFRVFRTREDALAALAP